VTGGRIDANIILRYFTGEPEEQAERTARLFEAVARGDELVLVEEVVLAEVVWTLASYYRMPRGDIANALLELLAEDNIEARDKESVRLALVIFSQRNLDFADALLSAKALLSDDKVVYSLDRDPDRIPGVIRKEP
jgi:predicted nucleic-acid-binding protein